MFEQRAYRSTRSSLFGQLDVIYHCTVQNLRSSHRTGGMGLLVNILQTLAMVAVFGGLMMVLGFRTFAIRGDFILFIMSGVFLFMTHNKSIGAVFGADGSTSAMMQHGPMNPIVAIVSASLAALYLQILTVLSILFVYHVVVAPIEIDKPVAAFGCLLLAWFSGIAIGMVFRAAKPWSPKPVTMIKTIYMRLNMISSGKFMVANSLPGFMIAFFDWNPLFHAIDQARGFTFINYFPHFSSLTYPALLGLGLMSIGLLGDFFTGKHASASWATR